MTDRVFKGSCFCQKVKFECSGALKSCIHCHCSTCQRLAGAPFATVALFEKFSLTEGAEHLGKLATSDKLARYSCKECFAPVHNEIAGFGSGVPISNFERDAAGKLVAADVLKPMAHIFYENRLFDVHDALPKFATKPPNFTMLTSTGEVVPPPAKPEAK